MILTWLLLCLSVVAAFPKGSHRGHTTLQTGSSITSPPGGQTRPVPMPWRSYPFFKKLSKRRRPSGNSGTAVHVANKNPVKPWGKGNRHVNVRPSPVVPVQPWIIPVHGHHHLPSQRIIVLTGNNVISLHPKGSSSGEKITQLFLTSGNSGISLHSSGCSLEHGCKETSLPKLDLPKLQEAELELGLPGIKIDDKLSIEGVLTDIVKAVKGEDLIFGELSGIGKGGGFETDILPSAIIVEKVIEDSVESGAEKLEDILHLSEPSVQTLEVAATVVASDTGKQFDTFEVNEDLLVESEVAKEHFLELEETSLETETQKTGVNIGEVKEDLVEEVLEIAEHLKEGTTGKLEVVIVDDILLLDELLDR